jgi:septal ring factor EnvC (AmiA/AmiB activator)
MRAYGVLQSQRNLLELQTTAQALELEYKQLFAAKLMREQQQQHDGVTVKSEPNTTEMEQSRLIELQEKYKAVRQEMHELREQMTDFKLKLEEYERFIAMLDGHLMGFEDTQTRQEEPTS